MVADVVSFVDGLKENPPVDAGSLDALPDAAIQQIVPRFIDSRTYQLAGPALKIQKSRGEPFEILKELDEIELFIVNAIDSRLSVNDLAIQVMQVFRIDLVEAFHRAKECVIFLAAQGIVHPAGKQP
jgi:hypothetical protein